MRNQIIIRLLKRYFEYNKHHNFFPLKIYYIVISININNKNLQIYVNACRGKVTCSKLDSNSETKSRKLQKVRKCSKGWGHVKEMWETV